MNISDYLIGNALFLRRLSVIVLIQLVSMITFSNPFPGALLLPSNCREIDISFEVTKDVNGGINNTIKIDLKEVKSSSVIISLVGPKKMFLKDIKETEIENLNKGTYSLVIVGRDESLGYCPKHFQVLID